MRRGEETNTYRVKVDWIDIPEKTKIGSQKKDGKTWAKET